MSLLMKALKRAEENRPAAPNAETLSADDLELEALTAESLRPQRPAAATSWSSAAAASLSAAHSPATPARNSVLPWVASFAALILTGWGIYVYLMVQAPAPLTVALPAPVQRPSVPEIRTPAEAPIPASEPFDTAPMQGSVADAPRLPAPAAEPNATAAMTHSAPASPANTSARAQENAVSVTRGAAASAPNPLLLSAYRAFQEGRFDEAHVQYQHLLQSEPSSQDAMLGLAAIALQRGDTAQAGRYYLRVSELDPKSAVAQAGIASLVGASDPAAAEGRLKQLLASQSAQSSAPEQMASLHFALGNLYAEQSRWADAEQAYFQAQRLAPGNPDYAFNLAVSLDHLFQPKPALTYYRRAEQLLRQRTANFSPSALAARIAQLSAASGAAAVESGQ